MTKFFWIFTLCLTSLLNNLPAESVLTWEDCVKEAKKNHPDLISAREKINQAKADKTITASSSLPRVSGSVSEKTSKASGIDQAESHNYSLTANQLLFDGSKTKNNVKGALESLKAAGYNYLVVSSNIRLDLRSAFIAGLKAEESLNITKKIAERRKQNYDLVKLRYEGGREHIGSVLSAEADLAAAQFEVNQAERKISLAQRQLTKELGRDKMTPFKIKGDLSISESCNEKPDFDTMIQSHPFLKELMARKEAAKFSVNSARAEFFPQIYLTASAGKSDSDWPPEDKEWSAGIGLTFPVFEGRSLKAGVDKSRAQLNQAVSDEKSGQNSVVLTLEDTWIKFQDATEKIKVQKKFLEAAEERAKIANAQYSTGLISFDNWTIIEESLVNARKSFLEAVTSALIAEAGWIQARGETLDYENK